MFDKAVVLYEGRQIYFGNKDAAKKYFTDMGFICPNRQTTADFLTSLTNPIERIIAPGYEHRVPRTPDEFAARWKDSQSRQQLLQEIQDYETEYPIDGHHLDKFRASRKAAQAKGMRAKSPYTISIPMQIKLCVERGLQRLQGDLTLFLSTVLGNAVMGLIISSVFYNLDGTTASFFSRGALLFFAILFAAMSSILEV
jgi:ATP-binding cassette subfamily G (WHITE) protein 2 (PDR)